MAEKQGKYFKQKVFFVLLILLSVGIYITWAVIAMVVEDVSFVDAFFDVGLYSFTIIPFLFGVLGFFLFRVKERESCGEF